MNIPKPKSPLELTMTENLERCTTVCTWEVTRERIMNTNAPPRHAILGDNWISLQDQEDALRLQELGYWELSPEGLAMKFLRLAWLAGWAELQAINRPWDGNTQRSWLEDD